MRYLRVMLAGMFWQLDKIQQHAIEIGEFCIANDLGEAKKKIEDDCCYLIEMIAKKKSQESE